MEWTLPWAGHLGLRGPDAPLFRHSAPSVDPYDQIDYMADLGFAGVQDNYAALRPADEQEKLAAHAARRGLRMASFVHDPTGWNLPHWSVTDEAGRARLVQELGHSLDTARRIDGHIVTCVTGIDPARPRAAQIAAMTDNLKRAGDMAAKAGVTLCVEAVSALWIPDLLVDTLDDAITMVAAVNHPAIRLMFDVAHIAMSGDNPLSAFERAREWIGAVQLADLPSGSSPGRIDVGGGIIDWVPLLRAIREHGYTGLFEIEHEAEGEGRSGEEQLIERLQAVDSAI